MAHTAESLQAAFGYLFVEEVAELKRLAQLLPDNPIVVNIGAGSGTSGLAFMESRPDLQLITIDVQREDSPFGCLSAEQKILADAGLLDWGRYAQYCIDSKEAARMYNGLVDMVFVDGDHSYPGAKGDILGWLPNIKPGGIMAVHDYDKETVYKDGPIEGAPHPLPWPGVDMAVRDFLCSRFETVSHVKTLITFRVTE